VPFASATPEVGAEPAAPSGSPASAMPEVDNDKQPEEPDVTTRGAVEDEADELRMCLEATTLSSPAESAATASPGEPIKLSVPDMSVSDVNELIRNLKTKFNVGSTFIRVEEPIPAAGASATGAKTEIVFTNLANPGREAGRMAVDQQTGEISVSTPLDDFMRKRLVEPGKEQSELSDNAVKIEGENKEEISQLEDAFSKEGVEYTSGGVVHQFATAVIRSATLVPDTTVTPDTAAGAPPPPAPAPSAPNVATSAPPTAIPTMLHRKGQRSPNLAETGAVQTPGGLAQESSEMRAEQIAGAGAKPENAGELSQQQAAPKQAGPVEVSENAKALPTPPEAKPTEPAHAAPQVPHGPGGGRS
jgi:hypothetical protein